MNIAAYFQGVIAELRKVTWPTVPTIVTYFLSVAIGISIATALVWAMDYSFIKLLSLLFK